MGERLSHTELGNVQTLLNSLLSSSSLDPVLVAIDFERPSSIQNHFQKCSLDTEVGLAILDTRGLSSSSNFTTFNFITGGKKYFAKSAPRCLWGTVERISVTSMLEKINDCLSPYQNRNIILIIHGASSDLSALRALGFGFQEHNVIAILDTLELALALHMGSFKLSGLVQELIGPCEKYNFHNAANDANFTLRVLMLLGIKGVGAAESNKTMERVEMLRCIALNLDAGMREVDFPQELMSLNEVKPLKKIKLPKEVKVLKEGESRQKRKSRTLEEQEDIREIRRLKREIAEVEILQCIVQSLDFKIKEVESWQKRQIQRKAPKIPTFEEQEEIREKSQLKREATEIVWDVIL